MFTVIKTEVSQQISYKSNMALAKCSLDETLEENLRELKQSCHTMQLYLILPISLGGNIQSQHSPVNQLNIM